MKPKFNIEDYKGKYVMHCDTKEKANAFYKKIHDDYYNDWQSFEENTCYRIDAKEFYDENDYTILEFDNFDWSEEEKRRIK
jgi:hypothetical protein